MTHQVQVTLEKDIPDPLGHDVRISAERDLGIKLESVRTIDVYTINSENPRLEERLNDVRAVFDDPVAKITSVDSNLALLLGEWNWVIEIGDRPGVTDNIGKTSKSAISDFLGIEFKDEEAVFASRQYVLKGDLTEEEVRRIASTLYNPLIKTAYVRTREQFITGKGMNAPLPIVKLPPKTHVDLVTELQSMVPDNEVDWGKVETLGKRGVMDPRKKDKDGKSVYRGPLALKRDYLEAIRTHFRNVEKRDPTDVEIEGIAQTWSEHCKHTIFAASMDNDVPDGLMKTYIKGETDRVRRIKGGKDLCVSVFEDNSGIIRFDMKNGWHLCYKIETHNSPSALDPYGGAITGIVGVNRDPMGTGDGTTRLVANIYGFCFGEPDKPYDILFKDKEHKEPLLGAKVIAEGVREGVEHGGNKSGISTAGFTIFDDGYRGKPLVFVGTVGLMPVEVNGVKTDKKSGKLGDLIVLAGNRTGADGIHGATFSSEEMQEYSPSTAVQIGDPITQKKLQDAQLEAALRGLYRAVTDNGAGGISCSVGELAHELGYGCEVELDAVLLKYKGIHPNEIWISESQERMTYVVPPENIKEFMAMMKKWDVEAAVIGKLTEERRCVVRAKGFNVIPGKPDVVMDIDMEFLHNGLPHRHLKTTYTPELYRHAEPKREERFGLDEMTNALYSMLNRLNVCSKEYIVRQFDHEVQGGSAIKPLVGRKQDVHSDATVMRPLLLTKPNGEPIKDSKKGFALGFGILPTYSFIDTYWMTAGVIDTAIRKLIAVGADLEKIVLLDNFCWCSSDDLERLGQLKRAAKACYDFGIEYETPFISGKDSMYNDFKGFTEDNKQVQISVPPTLLVSSLGLIENVEKCVTLDAKFAGDLVYVLGETKDELGGSEYYALVGDKSRKEAYIGNSVPRVDAKKNKAIYKKVSEAIQKELLASCHSVSVGGLGVALAEIAMAGELGLEVDLAKAIRSTDLNNPEDTDKMLFSESHGRLIVTVNPACKDEFEKLMEGTEYACVGMVTPDNRLRINGLDGKVVVDAVVGTLKDHYKKRLDWGYHQEDEHRQEAA